MAIEMRWTPKDAQKAAKMLAVEKQDEYAALRNGLRRMSLERKEYSGCPLPLDGQKLVIEPTFKYKDLDTIYDKPKEPEAELVKTRNIFWSHRKGCYIAVCEGPPGDFWAAPLLGSSNGASSILNTIGASDAWGIEQESAALQLLATMLRHRQFKQYLLTGSFVESSEKSKVHYVFRKLRPTIAIKANEKDKCNILCTLCMHPIGYYEESWAGCMCPTDDVIAHLALMRGDEKMFWRRCAQHPPHEPASGI